MDLIPSPSPSMKIHNMGGKVCLRCKGKTLLGIVNKHFIFKSLMTKPSNINLNFQWRWRWWDQIQAIFLNIFYFIILFNACFQEIFHFHFVAKMFHKYFVKKIIDNEKTATWKSMSTILRCFVQKIKGWLLSNCIFTFLRHGL